MRNLVDLLSVILSSLFGQLLIEKAPSVARWLISTCSWILADEARTRWTRDALSDLEYVDGNVSQLCAALSAIWHLPELATGDQARISNLRVAIAMLLLHLLGLATCLVAIHLTSASKVTAGPLYSTTHDILIGAAYVTTISLPIAAWLSLQIEGKGKYVYARALFMGMVWILSLPSHVEHQIRNEGISEVLTLGLVGVFATLLSAINSRLKDPTPITPELRKLMAREKQRNT